MANVAVVMASDRAAAMTGTSVNVTCGSVADQLARRSQASGDRLMLGRLTSVTGAPTPTTN